MEIILRKEDSYKPRHESAEEMKTSFFKDVYDGALTHICDILDFQKIHSNSKETKNDGAELNNIIAFVGERGSGKTSAMTSLIDAICDKKNGEKKVLLDDNSIINDSKINMLGKTKFYQIDLVDPTLFSGRENIIDVVISNMFKTFKKHIDETNNDSRNLIQVKSLLEAFQKIFSVLRTLKVPTEKLYGDDLGFSESDLERLNQLAIGPSLREKFEKLVEAYLKYFTEEGQPKAMLLIPIDDVDLHMGNTKNVGVIDHLEDIRKYLCVKHVTVLLGVNLLQLQANLQQTYLNLYGVLFNDKDNGTKFKEPQEMAAHFLEKLMPSKRRLILPVLNNTNVSSIRFKKGTDETLLKQDSIGGVINALIQEKTGLTLITSKIYNRHPFLPKTLREFHHLYYLLEDLPSFTIFTHQQRKEFFEDVSQNEVSKENRLKWEKIIGDSKISIDFFESHLLNVWAPTNLPPSFLELVIELKQTPQTLKNKFLCTRILDCINKYSARKERATKLELGKTTDIVIDTLALENDLSAEIEAIAKRKNNPNNVSLGDVIFLLKIIKDYFDFEDIDKLTFIIKAIYSITIIKLVEVEVWEFLVNNPGDPYGKYNSKLAELQDVIGESIYSPSAIRLLPQTEDQRKSTKNEIINRRSKFAIGSFAKQLAIKYKDSANQGFFDFCLFVSIFKRDHIYREANQTMFKKALHNQTEEASFNILSFFTNILNIEEFKSRYHTDFIKVEFPNDTIMSINKWLIDYGVPLPFYNIEFIEEMLYKICVNKEILDIGKESGDKRDNRIYFKTLFKELNKLLDPHFAEVWQTSPFFFMHLISNDNDTTLEGEFFKVYNEALNVGYLVLMTIYDNFKGKKNKPHSLTLNVSEYKLLIEFLQRSQQALKSESGDADRKAYEDVLVLLRSLHPKRKVDDQNAGVFIDLFDRFYANVDLQ